METAAPSARQIELLEAAYRYVLEHGLAELSLRPLATAVGSSPRVLLYLFGSKEGLVRALLARARRDELALLEQLGQAGPERLGSDQERLRSSQGRPGEVGLGVVTERVWTWLSEPEHRALLALWAEAYARSLVDPLGPWAGFASDTVQDWLTVLAEAQPEALRDTENGVAERTLTLAVLRGALLDLLATGDNERVDAAVGRHLKSLRRE